MSQTSQTNGRPVAIVTGSAAGLGAAIAKGLAAEGHDLVLNCTKSLDDAEAVKAAIEAQGAKAVIAVGDVGDDAVCRMIAETAMKTYGRIDVLVNNVGATKFVGHGDLDGLSAEDFTWIYRTNVVSAFQMIRACRGPLSERRPGADVRLPGAVVNVSSIAGVAGIGSSVAYAASKGALNTMTLSLARALAPDIRVNAICPGFIGTGWFRDRFGEERFAGIVAQMEQQTPLRQAGTPEMVAEAAIFFATPRSRHVTGEFMIIDAGLHLDMNPTKAR